MGTSVAQLKLEALLAEVKVDYEALQPSVDAALEAFKEAVCRIPEREVSPSLCKGFLEDLGVPHNKSRMVFRPPESVSLIGSYTTRTMAAETIQPVDLAIRIPKACFYEKDYLNHRYHAKRALYLAFVHRYLLRCSKFQSVEWAFLQHDARKPFLIVRPESGSFVFHVIPTISSSLFDVAKLDRTRNNVRVEGNEEGPREPTPNYNETILEDMFVEERWNLARQGLLQATSLRDAIILVKVWLRVKGHRECPDKLNGLTVSMLILHLASSAGSQRLTGQMTALQAFRIVLETIGTQNTLAKGFKLQLQDQSPLKSVLPKDTVTVLDTYGRSNLAFRMSKSAVEELRNSACEALNAIKVFSLDSGFDECFLRKAGFAARFDYHIRTKIGSSVAFVNEEAWRRDESKVEKVLAEGLSDRAMLVRVVRRSLLPGWSPKKSVLNFVESTVYVGVKLSSFDTAFRMVDVGPSADNKIESAKFRSFWGPKAELRRFKDGTIAETAAWERNSWQRHLIVPDMVRYILNRHLLVAENDVETVSGQLDFALLEKGLDPICWTSKILEVFDRFSKRLRSLSLPLKIVSVQPLSAAFRHAAVFLPGPQKFAARTAAGNCVEPLEVMVQLEGSGRWPNDQVAVQKTKAAFCLQIADSIEKDYHIPSVVSEDSVDILMEGFAFRISVHYEKDRSMVNVKGDAIKHPAVTDLRPEDDLTLRSVHSSMLYGFQGRYPAFGPVVRLAKRWIAAHLLSPILAEEVVELLVAYLFLGPSSPPSTRITGLLRFLQLLATFDWSFSPLIVDINGDMSLKDREAITACFRSGAVPAMFVATPYDLESTTWTKFSPSKQQLKRLVAFASSSAALLEDNILGKNARWQSLYRTPLKCYDAVIRLQKKSLPFPDRVLFPFQIETEGVLECSAVSRPLAMEIDGGVMVGFNPLVYFVSEVKAKFGDVFHIWYDSLGGDLVGLSLKEKQAQARKRKRDVDSLKSMLEEVASIGLGLVQSIHY